MNINTINTILKNTEYFKKQSALHTGRLSSGLKINQASDNPSLIHRIHRLNSEIIGKDTGNKNIQDGISLIQTVESSLSIMQNMGERLKQLSVSYNSDTISTEDKKLIANESMALLKEMNKTKDNTKFNNQNIFSKTYYDIQTGENTGDKYTINIPTLNIVSNEELDSGLLNSSVYTITGRSIGILDKGNSSSNTAPKEYTLTAPTVNIPDQGTYTGYKQIYGDNGKLLYDGFLENGKLNGFGKLYDDKGNLSYKGFWTDNNYDKFGKLYGENGKLKYVGDISNGTPDGYGTYFSDKGIIQYQGFLKDGYREGFGTTYASDGKLISSKIYKDYSIANGEDSEEVTDDETDIGDSNVGENGNMDDTTGTDTDIGMDNDTDAPPSIDTGIGDGNIDSDITPPTSGETDGTNDDTNGDVDMDDTNGDVNNGGTNGNVGTGDTNGDINSDDTNGDVNIGGTNEDVNNGETNGDVNTGDTNGNVNNDNTNGDINNGNTNGNVNNGTTNGDVDNDKINGNGNVNNDNTNGETSDNIDNSIFSTILNPDYIDKYILNPISEGLSSLGIQEKILNYRYDFNENQNNINTNTLSNIQDSDTAKDLLAQARANMLLQVNSSLFSAQLSFDKNYILTILT